MLKKLRAFLVAAGPKNVATTLLELAGFGSISAGVGQIYAPAGWIAAGSSALVVGYLAGRS